MMTLAIRNPKMVPTGLQNFFEMVYEFVDRFWRTLGGQTRFFFFPSFLLLFLFIFFANLMGLIPGPCPDEPGGRELGMALIVFLSTHFFGIKQKGILKYLKHFLPRLSR